MITIEGMRTLLESVTGFAGKVAYYAFPKDEAPDLPFVCFMSPRERTFAADNISYFTVPRIVVELYTKDRDLATEALFETAFRAAGLYFTKESEYLDDERIQATVFSF